MSQEIRPRLPAGLDRWDLVDLDPPVRRLAEEAAAAAGLAPEEWLERALRRACPNAFPTPIAPPPLGEPLPPRLVEALRPEAADRAEPSPIALPPRHIGGRSRLTLVERLARPAPTERLAPGGTSGDAATAGGDGPGERLADRSHSSDAPRRRLMRWTRGPLRVMGLFLVAMASGALVSQYVMPHGGPFDGDRVIVQIPGATSAPVATADGAAPSRAESPAMRVVAVAPPPLPPPLPSQPALATLPPAVPIVAPAMASLRPTVPAAAVIPAPPAPPPPGVAMVPTPAVALASLEPIVSPAIADPPPPVEVTEAVPSPGDAVPPPLPGRKPAVGRPAADAAPKPPPAQVAGLEERAKGGDALAQYRLGVSYAMGQGVAKDYERAATLFRSAAEKGLAEAQYNIAVMYDEGMGVPHDATQAVAWYRKAAAQGSAAAAFNLGIAFANGAGVPQGIEQAAYWFARAARQGVVNAQFNLGLLYERGDGVPASQVEAYAWFSAAAARGDAGAAQRRDRLAAAFSPADLKEAQARAESILAAIEEASAGTASSARR